jgi:hypothetical protein
MVLQIPHVPSLTRRTQEATPDPPDFYTAFVSRAIVEVNCHYGAEAVPAGANKLVQVDTACCGAIWPIYQGLAVL